MPDLSSSDIRTIRNILLAFAGVLIIYMMKVLSSLLIPFILALFIAILLQPVLALLDRKKVPFSLSLGLISVFTIGIMFLLGLIVVKTGQSIYAEKDFLINQVVVKLKFMIDSINNMTGLSINLDDALLQIPDLLSNELLFNTSGVVAGALGSFTGTFSLTAVYLIILLGSILKYENYLHYLDEGNITADTGFLHTFEQVKSSIVTYIKVKFVMSVFTGLGTYIICLIFGIKFALFWGFFAFITNFIPTIGSIIGTVPPCLMGLIQMDSAGMILFLIGLLFAVQTLFGNILEPIYMGSSVSINTIAIIMGLVFWGYLWGIYGMLMAVPLMVLVKVILSQVEGAQVLVKLMGPVSDSRRPGKH